jgi:hypothetical protein
MTRRARFGADTPAVERAGIAAAGLSPTVPAVALARRQGARGTAGRPLSADGGSARRWDSSHFLPGFFVFAKTAFRGILGGLRHCGGAAPRSRPGAAARRPSGRRRKAAGATKRTTPATSNAVPAAVVARRRGARGTAPARGQNAAAVHAVGGRLPPSVSASLKFPKNAN